jgi:hypothetical protein
MDNDRAAKAIKMCLLAVQSFATIRKHDSAETVSKDLPALAVAFGQCMGLTREEAEEVLDLKVSDLVRYYQPAAEAPE